MVTRSEETVATQEVASEEPLPPLDSDLSDAGVPLLVEEQGDVSSEPAGESTEEVVQTTEPSGQTGESTEEAPQETETPPPPQPVTYTQEQVARIESAYRQRENEARELARQAEERAAQAELLIRADQYQQERTEYHINAGESPERAATLAEQDRNSALTEVARRQSEAQAFEANRRAAAIAVAHDHNLPPSELPNLARFNTAEEMNQYAEGLKTRSAREQELTSTVETLRKEIDALKKAQVPAGGLENQVDSGEGATPPLTDTQLIDRAGDPDVDLTESELMELDAAMRRSGLLE